MLKLKIKSLLIIISILSIFVIQSKSHALSNNEWMYDPIVFANQGITQETNYATTVNEANDILNPRVFQKQTVLITPYNFYACTSRFSMKLKPTHEHDSLGFKIYNILNRNFIKEQLPNPDMCYTLLNIQESDARYVNLFRPQWAFGQSPLAGNINAKVLVLDETGQSHVFNFNNEPVSLHASGDICNYLTASPNNLSLNFQGGNHTVLYFVEYKNQKYYGVNFLVCDEYFGGKHEETFADAIKNTNFYKNDITDNLKMKSLLDL